MGGKGEWRWGQRTIIYLSLHCHQKNDSCIKTGSDEIHFNVSLIVRDKVTRQCPQTTTYLKRKESGSWMELRPFFLTARSHRLTIPLANRRFRYLSKTAGNGRGCGWVCTLCYCNSARVCSLTMWNVITLSTAISSIIVTLLVFLCNYYDNVKCDYFMDSNALCYCNAARVSV